MRLHWRMAAWTTVPELTLSSFLSVSHTQACLKLVAARETRYRVQWYYKLFEQTMKGLNRHVMKFSGTSGMRAHAFHAVYHYFMHNTRFTIDSAQHMAQGGSLRHPSHQ
jgi:hypothetical protein